jgi:phosphohistidine phosphatase
VETGGLDVPLDEADALYNASGDGILTYVRQAPDAAQSLLVVAHMPGVGELLSLLTTEHGDLACAVPAGTVAAVSLDIHHWADADYGTGTLTLFWPPLLALA